eukprot:5166432-Amphidinium_carterae.2
MDGVEKEHKVGKAAQNNFVVQTSKASHHKQWRASGMFCHCSVDAYMHAIARFIYFACVLLRPLAARIGLSKLCYCKVEAFTSSVCREDGEESRRMRPWRMYPTALFHVDIQAVVDAVVAATVVGFQSHLHLLRYGAR